MDLGYAVRIERAGALLDLVWEFVLETEGTAEPSAPDATERARVLADVQEAAEIVRVLLAQMAPGDESVRIVHHLAVQCMELDAELSGTEEMTSTQRETMIRHLTEIGRAHV